MKASDKAINLITEFEGFSSTPYMDENDGMTIGYGHLIKKGESFTAITRMQGRAILKQDVAIAENAIAELVTGPLTQGMYDALVSFVFNIGRGQFKHSTMRERLNAGDRLSAFQEFDRWIIDDGKKLLGLARRRAGEGVVFLSD